MAQSMQQITDTWMTNPYMFDPSQLSNAYSNYNNAALPWPPTYNTGAAGGPVNAATGQPIQSFQQWQQANPAGMSINSTPATPAAPQAQTPTGVIPFQHATMPDGMPYGQTSLGRGVVGSSWQPQQQPMAAAPRPRRRQRTQAAPQASAAPNNWQAALNALANPGKVTTPGATVPMVQGSQPAGGINAAFLQQAGAGAGMNQGFLSALRAIQGRPQQ